MKLQISRLFISFLIVCLFFGSHNLYGQTQWRSVENNAFTVGEKIKFSVYYDAFLTGKVTAGIGTAEVKESDKLFYGRPVYHIDTEGRSKGLFHFFFKVRDEFDSFLDKEFLAPHHFIRNTREGDYKKYDEYAFNQEEQYVVTYTDSMDIPRYTQDFISAVYYARTFEDDTLEEGDMFFVDFFLDDSVYHSAVIFEGREIVEIELGVFQCLRLKPMMVVGEVFSQKYPMTMWVTDDKNHLPILAKSAVIVGNIKMELIEFEGLANESPAILKLYR